MNLISLTGFNTIYSDFLISW